MPIHIQKMTSDVLTFNGDLPLTEAQIEKLVKIIIKRIEESQRQNKQNREATTIRRSVIAPDGIEG